MISAKAFRDFLFCLNRRVKHTHPAHDIEITVSMIEKANVSMSDAKEILSILANHPNYKCLQVIQYRELQYANDEYGEKEVFALVRVTPNFNGIFEEVDAYYSYKLNPKNKKVLYYSWSSNPKSEKVIRKPRQWQDIVDTATHSSQIDWSSVVPNSDGNQLQTSSQAHKARINLIGNEIVLTLEDGRKSVVKKLRTDQAPLFFIRYLLLNPNQLIPRTVIQTSVEMCAQKDDMTELVRQCGFNKNLKKYFFNGTSKTKVMLTAEAELPNEIVDQIII